MGSPSVSRDRICSWWQNTALVAASLVYVIGGLSLGASWAVKAVHGDAGELPAVAAAVVVVAGAAVLAVRSTHIGVYRHSGGLLIRGFVRTMVIDRGDIRGVVMETIHVSWAGPSYLPVIILDDPPPPTGVSSVMLSRRPTRRQHQVRLWWLGSLTPEGTQRRIDEFSPLLRAG